MSRRFNTLRSIMPKTGMKYESKFRLMHHGRRDKLVANSLSAAGVPLTREGVSKELQRMFAIAILIVGEARFDKEDLWDSLPLLQKRLAWASTLSMGVFFEFFCCLVVARHEWEKAPTYPYFRYEEYDPAVLSLVTFRRAVGDGPWEDHEEGGDFHSWILGDAIVFIELAGGLDEDEEQDVEMDEGVTQPMKNLSMENEGDGKKNVKGGDDIIPPMEDLSIEQREQ